LRHLEKRLAHVQGVGHAEAAVRPLALKEFQNQALAALGDVGELAGELHGVGHPDLGPLTARLLTGRIGHQWLISFVLRLRNFGDAWRAIE